MLDLTDRDAVNERVAKAMGWEYRGKKGCRHHWRRWAGAGWSHNYGSRTDYLSDDPALNDEMWKALPREVNTWWRHSEGPVSTGERWHWVQRGWDTGGIDTCGTTFAEALVLALDAAGLLKED